MNSAKDMYDSANKDLVSKIAEIDSSMQRVGEALEPLKKRVESGSDDKAKSYLSQLASSAQYARGLASEAKSNIESVKERLELKKISYEAREIAARSWPRKTLIERLTWVSTALFPSGGIPFVFTGGVTEASLAVAVVTWSAAIILLIASLWALKNEDKRKWEFFKNQFDIKLS